MCAASCEPMNSLELTLALPLRHCTHATATACRLFLLSGAARCSPGSSEAGAIACHRSGRSICFFVYSEDNYPRLSGSARAVMGRHESERDLGGSSRSWVFNRRLTPSR